MTVVLSLLSLLLIHAVCRRHAAQAEVSPVALQVPLSAALAAAKVRLLSWLLMRCLRVMWFEAFAVYLVILVDCLAELFLSGLNWRCLKAARSDPLRMLVGGSTPDKKP